MDALDTALEELLVGVRLCALHAWVNRYPKPKWRAGTRQETIAVTPRYFGMQVWGQEFWLYRQPDLTPSVASANMAG